MKFNWIIMAYEAGGVVCAISVICIITCFSANDSLPHNNIDN